MTDRWRWHGEYLKVGDPDWVADATEPTASDLSLGVFDGGMVVHTPRGDQRARKGDWLVRDDDGGVWIDPFQKGMSCGEIGIAGYLLADLLCSSLMPSSGSWFYARPTYIWEHNALCWLHRNRERIPTMNAWTAMLVRDGYPAKDFISGDDQPLPAGAWWSSSMAPKEDGSTPARPDKAEG